MHPALRARALPRLLGAAFVAAFALGAAPVRAQNVTAAECVAANEQAGPLRRAGKLRESRANLRKCSAQKCPAVVRKDCVAAAAQADADVPTLAFSVHDPAGNDLSAVKVTVDGQPFAEKLDGSAIEVDPGEHLFTFETPGQPKLEKRFVIIEGEKNRHERLQIGEPPPPPPVVVPPPVVLAPPPPPPANHRRAIGLVTGGSGLLVMAVGGVFGLFAITRWNDAKTACGSTFPESCKDPAAASSDRTNSVTSGTIADVTLGLGAAALVTGAVLVLTAPAPGSTSAARLTVRPDVSARAGGLVLGGVF